MNAAKVILVSTVVAAVFGLALSFGATSAQAHHCKGAHDFPGCTSGGGGAGGGGGGGTTPIGADIGSGSALDPDLVGTMYSDSERDIKANAGPGIFINLRGTGNDPRTVQVNVTCTNPNLSGEIIGGTTGCADFMQDVVNGVRDPVFGVQRPDVSLTARPYAVNCPEGGECLDAFTMGLGPLESIQMGFAVGFHEGVRLDIASAVGGFTAKNPGRCLSVMTPAERSAFLDFYCGIPDPSTGIPEDFADCNVTVTAHDTVIDGRNDSWNIVAANDTGLICNRFPDVFVIGVATGVTFEIQADVE